MIESGSSRSRWWRMSNDIDTSVSNSEESVEITDTANVSREVPTNQGIEEVETKRICGAKTSSGKVCQKHPMKGKTRCHKHGGKTPCGMASPHWKGGKYSKYVPKGLKNSYERALSDAELLSLRDDIALLESRQVEILETISKANEGAPQWEDVARTVDRVCLAVASGNEKSRTVSLQDLVKIVREGVKSQGTVQRGWEELRETLQDKIKATSAEAKRLDEMNQTMTKQEALNLMGLVISAVRDNVSDSQVLGRIQERLNSVLIEHKPSATVTGDD
jgi:hypothetical protein